MSFDLNDPKIILALLLGGMVPYLIMEVPTTITKWLLFIAILGRRPRISTVLVVALAEAVCLFLAMMSTGWLGIPRSLVFAVYLALAFFPNLLLFPSTNHPCDNSLPKRCVSAFALGLLFPVWVCLVLLANCAWHGRL